MKAKESNSLETKREILPRNIRSRRGKFAFLSAIIHTTGSIILSSEGLKVKVVAGSLLKPCIDEILFDCYKAECVCEGSDFIFCGDYVEKMLFDTYILKETDGIKDFVLGLDEDLAIDETAKICFIKGAFLGSGNISVSSGYHLEFVLANPHLAADLADMIQGFGIMVKIATRKDKTIIYLKDGQMISDLLALMGANKAVLKLNEYVAERQHNQYLNRANNCDIANIDKMIDTSIAQINAILNLEKKVGLSALPEKLESTARLRLQYSECSYAELAQMLSISKSGVKHRLTKITEIARSLCGDSDEKK